MIKVVKLGLNVSILMICGSFNLYHFIKHVCHYFFLVLDYYKSFGVLLIIKLIKMNHLIQLSMVIALFFQSIAFSQTANLETTDKENGIITNVENQKEETQTNTYEDFIGSYYLTEANLTLTITQESDKYYLVSPGAKDMLTKKNDTTLYEAMRGVTLERIEGDKNALKFTQNGYVTTIKRVDTKEGK